MLSKGQQLKTISGDEITIKEFIAEGGQGEVYKVDYQGEEKALKWFEELKANKHAKLFYENIKNNIEKGKPSNEFLWPLKITEWQDNTFGYIMDLRPSGYYSITEYMLCSVRFKSYRTVTDACLKIVSAFRTLHCLGYSYQDINDGNFFINPENGDVLICDNDNVAPDKVETGIFGKPRYLAPEIILGKNKPNSLSDRFSMAVILYILFCLNHPLEGRRSLENTLTPKLQKQIYGTEPIFIMDPNDKRNGPDPVAHKNSIMLWKYLPKYMKDIFIKAFSKESFENPTTRPIEIDWLKALTRFRSEIIDCACGNEVFTENGESRICDNCGKEIKIPLKLEFKDYSIPAISNNNIYRCQLGVCDPKEALNIVASVVANKDTDELYLCNKTENCWKVITQSGENKTVSPNDKIALEDGMTFVIYDQEVKVKKEMIKAISLVSKLEEIPRRELTVFFVLDTSLSMCGTPIAELNHGVEECAQALKELAKSNGDAILKIAIMEFNSDCRYIRWITPNGPVPVEDFGWEYLEAGGLSSIGSALKELNSKLSCKEFLQSMKGSFMPVIIFMTNGHATDDYQKPLVEIRKNKWFNHSTKIGFAVGDEADERMIASIVGNSEAVIKTSDILLFKKLMRFVSVRDSMFDDATEGNKAPKTSDIDDDWDDDDWDYSDDISTIEQDKKETNMYKPHQKIVKNTKAKITMDFDKSQQMKDIVEFTTESLVKIMLNDEKSKNLHLDMVSKNTNNMDLNKKIVIELYENREYNDLWDDDEWD